MPVWAHWRLAGAVVALAVAVGGAAAAAARSGVTGVDVTGTQVVGTFGGVEYDRVKGVIHGRVAADEKVAGLAALPKDADGAFDYTAEFELVAPSSGSPADTVVFVEAENRGMPVFLSGLGAGFLSDHHIAYARVQWQTGIAAGVPDHAQGVGEVVMRDFARLLAGERQALPTDAPGLGAYKIRILGAISQSAWFVNVFIAEGFNADPETGRAVFDGAIAVDGTGNWLPINQLAAESGLAEYPYPNETAKPLTPDRLLKRPASDPFYVDIANLSDFYRVRASVSESTGIPARMRRYDWPSPHATGSAGLAAMYFGRAAGCNGGVAVALDPITYGPYARAAVLALIRRAGGAGFAAAPALPPTTRFVLGPPPDDSAHFNALPGVALKTPVLDERGEPLGGVRFPEVEEPVGTPMGNLPHVGLDSIRDFCGNLMEWQPYSAEQLTRAYGSQDAWLKRYERSLDRLIAAGYLLPEDKAGMMTAAAAAYRNPAGS